MYHHHHHMNNTYVKIGSPWVPRYHNTVANCSWGFSSGLTWHLRDAWPPTKTQVTSTSSLSVPITNNNIFSYTISFSGLFYFLEHLKISRFFQDSFSLIFLPIGRSVLPFLQKSFISPEMWCYLYLFNSKFKMKKGILKAERKQLNAALQFIR